MIRILILAESRPVRDAWEVALQQFPGFGGIAAAAAEGLEKLREDENFHLVVVEKTGDPEGLVELLERLRAEEAPPVVVAAREEQVRRLQGDKRRLGVTAFLRLPLQAVEVFRLLGRLQERLGTLDLTRV